jgi:hypothetical protein
MDIKRKLAVGAGALTLLGIGSLGIGVAGAQTPAPPPAATQQVTPTPDSETEPQVVGANEAPDAGPDDPNGHADPPGVDVQNQGGANEL